MSALRSILFALYQLVVTPIYAIACSSAVVAAADTAVQVHHGLVLAELVRCALDLRHPPARDRPRQSSSVQHPAHRHVQALVDLGNAGAEFRGSTAGVRRQEGTAGDSIFRLGVQAGLADHHRSQVRQRCHDPDRHPGTRAAAARFLDRDVSGRNAHSRGYADALQDRRCAPGDRAGRANRPGGA